MEDGLLLNLELDGPNTSALGQKLSWKEKKQLKRERQQRVRRRAGTTAAAPPSAYASRNPQTSVASFRLPAAALYGAQVAPAAGQRGVPHPAGPSTAAADNHQRAPQKQQEQLQRESAVTARSQLTKRKRDSSPDVLDPTEHADLLELVAFNLGKEQQLVAEDPELERHTAAAAAEDDNGGAGGVVEFGDADDEVDYRQWNKRPKNGKQQQGRSSTGAGGAAAGGGKKGKPQQALQQHKVGQLARAETAVPAEARMVLFGEAPAVTSQSPGAPITWEDLGVTSMLADHLGALNFTAPTKVQQAALPALLQGRDALVRSPTGSGKTLAYLVPLVLQLQAAQPRIQRSDGTHAVILAPTRELALQISDVLTALLRRCCWLVGGMLIGGENRSHEKARLRKGVTVVVATPGRIIDHLENTNSFRVDRCRHLILDEADRLLDLGFEAKLRTISDTLSSRSSLASSQEVDAVGGSGSEPGGPVRRQTVMISATLHPGLQALASFSMTDPVAVGFSAQQLNAAAAAAAGQGDAGEADGAGAEAGSAAGQQEEFSIPSQLLQQYVEVQARLRLVALIGALRSRLRRNSASKVVVFFSSCVSVDFHHTLLTQPISLNGFSGPEGRESDAPQLLLPGLLKLHGDMPQAERTSAFLTFSQAKSGVLFCTDVAARGLDFPAVTCIIQYDAAGEASEYVHRVGRTARMGHKGEALLFVLPSEQGYVALLESQGVSLTQQPLPALFRCLPDADAARFLSQGGSKKQRKAQWAGEEEEAGGEYAQAAVSLQRALVRHVAADQELTRQAQAAFRSFVGAYSVHPKHLKPIFSVRALHLGHVAASFALAAAPSAIGGSGSAAAARKAKQQKARAGKGAAYKAMRKGAHSAMHAG